MLSFAYSFEETESFVVVMLRLVPAARSGLELFGAPGHPLCVSLLLTRAAGTQ